MGRKLSDIRQVIRQLLRDEFDEDVTGEWEDDEMDVHIESCLYELSIASPYRAFEPLPVTANSKILDISGLADLIRIRHIEYEPGGDPRNYHNIEQLDNETIEMKVDAAPSESGASGTLTGTVTFTSGSATVTGSGTDFDGELEAGDYIKPSTKGRWYRVYSVESDTSLTLDETVKSADAGADTADVTQYRHDVALVYYDKLHTLTEEESTLKPDEESLLILGVCGHAAISKARSLINRVNTGGGNTPNNMNGWGLTKLSLFEEKIKRLKPPEIKKAYSTG